MRAIAHPVPDFLGTIVNRRSVPGFRLTETVLTPGSRTPRHFHDHGMIGWSLRGGYANAYGMRTQLVEGSRVMFCPPGEQHTTVSPGGSVSFAVELDAEWLRRFGEVALPATPALFDLGSVSSVMHRLHREFRETDTSSAIAIEGMVLELIAAAMRLQTQPLAPAPRWLLEARDVIDATYLQQITISGVADRVQVHPVHLATTFRHKYGQGIVEYIRGRRIDFASRQLSDSDAALAAIAQAAGFCDQSHFSRTFKQVTGMTPAAYRAKSRNHDR